nr:ribosomal protein L36 [Sarcophyte sanguinea]WJE89102.1 ribosomal protein L36 [Sarcophyte sanguinea]WJE89121.1 ribosomal protein L36 [Sarcophyte sanguinea]
MKIKTSIRKICKKCKLIIRQRRILIICYNPKHKQRQK